MNTKVISMYGALLTLLFACSETLEPTPYTYTQVFTGETKKGWTVRNLQLLESGKGTQTFNLPDCRANDIYVFHNNSERRFEILEGSSKCDPADPDTIVEDTWSFVNSGAALTIVFPLLADGPLPFVVKEAEENRMTIEIFFNDNKSSYRINFRSTTVD